MSVATGIEATIKNKSKLNLLRSHTAYAKPFLPTFSKRILGDTRILAINKGQNQPVLTNCQEKIISLGSSTWGQRCKASTIF